MEKIKQELYDVYVKYKDFDFMNHYYKVSNTNTNNKYSKGIAFTAGLYEPYYVDEMRCGNATIGKEIKNIDKGYDYKYYFDENNRIILSEKYLSGKLYYINFYFYVDNILEFINYEVNRGIYSLSKSFYDDNDRIYRHIQIGIFDKYNPIENSKYNEHLSLSINNHKLITNLVSSVLPFPKWILLKEIPNIRPFYLQILLHA